MSTLSATVDNARKGQKQCDHCKNYESALSGKFQVCGGCQTRRYCSAACSKQDWKESHKAKCAYLKRQDGRAELSAMVAPLAPLLISSSPAYLQSLQEELPFLLVEAFASLTTSTHLAYSTDAPPASRRLASLSRDAMLQMTMIPLLLDFNFDPRKPDQRTQFSLERAELLTRAGADEEVRLMERSSEDESGGRSFAQSEAREALLQKGKGVTSFYVMCRVAMGPDVPGRNERRSLHNLIYRAVLRPDAFERPATGSTDWFKFLRKKLSAKQPLFGRLGIGGGAVYEVTEEEAMVAFLEVARLIAVEKADYPPDKEVDMNDSRFSVIMTILSAGLSKPKGVVIPEGPLQFAREVMARRAELAPEGIKKVLQLRALKATGR
ncbi:hypothetical protein RQP46_003756 [Phenoliferia psychrophenolica]